MGWGRTLVVGVASSLAALGAAGCSGGGGGPDAGRHDAQGDVPTGTIVAGDAGLVGTGDDPHPLVVSDDDGRTWRSVELPDEPRELSLTSLVAGDDVLAAAGRDEAPASPELPVASSEILVWTSADGDRWDGHALTTSGPVVAGPDALALGSVLVAAAGTSAGVDLFASADRGSSWDRAAVTGLDVAPGVGLALVGAGPPDEGLFGAEAGDDRLRMVVHPTDGYDHRHWILTSTDDGASWSATLCALDCTEVLTPGAPVVRGDEATTDGGATWHPVSVDPPPSDQDGPFLSTPVEVPGGWLVSASTSDPGDTDHSVLLRSADGLSWRQMLPPDTCNGNTSDSDLSDPFRFRGRWYVTYGCTEDRAPTSAVLYDGGADARTFEPVDGTERDGAIFGTPVRHGDRLLLPEYADVRLGGNELVGITTLG